MFVLDQVGVVFSSGDNRVRLAEAVDNLGAGPADFRSLVKRIVTKLRVGS